MADPQALNVLKDIVVPLAAAAIGAGAALAAGYYAVVKPQREQRRFEDASARLATTAFFQAVKLAASTINTGQQLGVMEVVLRQHIVRYIDTIPKLALRLNRALPDAEGQDQFHLMIIELDRLGHGPVLDRHTVSFAYGAAATTGLLLATSERDDCTAILAAIIKDTRDKELAGFFGLVVDRVLPLEIRREVRGQAPH